jgi:hypothetical protein
MLEMFKKEVFTANLGAISELKNVYEKETGLIAKARLYRLLQAEYKQYMRQ